MSASNTTNNVVQIYTYFTIAIHTVSIISVAANILLLCVFVSDKFFRKTTYYLMIICILSDVASSISSVISTNLFLNSKINQLHNAVKVCHLHASVFYISYGISIMNLCLIGIDRYFALVNPLNMFYKIYKRQIIIIIELLIWIIAVIVVIPNFWLLQPGRDYYGRFFCDYLNMTLSTSAYLVSFSFVFYILPSMIILIVYWQIIIFQRNYIRPSLQKQRLQRDLQNKQKLTKSLICISTCYVIATFPYFLILLAMGITGKNLTQIQGISPAIFVLSILAASMANNINIINPFLYLKFDGNIRKRLHKILKHPHGGER
ncbi:Dopamine receptor 4 [Trichoplax sp. H2]|nr:Dopamine receptor 4 [Trichoplax sp. H2]|eukprot:RDD39710.1 Dopamine receptor 4 [Trichoplax sp. H2]